MKISCCWLYAIELYGYPTTVEDTYKALKRIAKLGFIYTEIEAFGFLNRGNIEELWNEKTKLREYIDNLGLKIVNFPIILPGLVSLDKKERERNLKLFDKGLEVAKYLNSEIVQLDSFTPPLEFVGAVPYKETLDYGKQFKVRVDPNFRWKEQWDAIVDSFSKCNEKLKKVGIKMTVEPRVGEIISNTDAMLRLMDAIKDPNFGAVLEIPHQHAQKEILPLSVEKLGNRIYYVHAADNDGKDNAHNNLGHGTVDWEGIFTALKKNKFEGYVAIDVRPVGDIDEEYTETKRFIEKLAERLSM